MAYIGEVLYRKLYLTVGLTCALEQELHTIKRCVIIS